MPTLLLRVRAPMMSWGDHSRFTIRDTRTEPTKSAIIGLICAALGRPRWESVNDLAALTMGVRVDKEGIVQCDYHTIKKAITSDGQIKKPPKDTVPSYRYYIADADFVVGLEGKSRSFLEQLDRALQQPKWQLYFGRKSFIPSRPVRIGIQDVPLLRTLQQYPYEGKRKVDRRLRYVLEVPNSLDVRQDVPIDWLHRQFGSRCVKTEFYPMEVYAECTSPS